MLFRVGYPITKSQHLSTKISSIGSRSKSMAASSQAGHCYTTAWPFMYERMHKPWLRGICIFSFSEYKCIRGAIIQKAPKRDKRSERCRQKWDGVLLKRKLIHVINIHHLGDFLLLQLACWRVSTNPKVIIELCLVEGVVNTCFPRKRFGCRYAEALHLSYLVACSKTLGALQSLPAD